MISYWDILPIEIQEIIQKLAAANFIQETFKKNREWFLLRIRSIKKMQPNYDGKGYRVGDRVLLRQNHNKLTYGTISSISYNYEYYCRVNLLNNKKLYFYNEKNKKIIKKPHENILQIILLQSWNLCMCNICKQRNQSNKCDHCLFNNL